MSDPAVLDGRRVLLDSRWLGRGGPGRATELLLRGLAEIDPPGEWLLWGSEEVEAFAWPGASWLPTDIDPHSLAGQRGLRLPKADVTIHMHQIRPLLRSRATVTVIHDTIPLRHGGNAVARAAKKLFFLLSARSSSQIVTDSRYSKDCLMRDLKVPGERITVIPFPVDSELVARITALRADSLVEPRILYVGRFGSHKNLRRLVEAFVRTDFASQQGQLWMVGGSPPEVAEVESMIRGGVGRSGSETRIVVRGGISQGELEVMYATSRLVILPSLEEGFGLPIWEARCAGIPTLTSDGGSLPEVADPDSIPFAARSVEEMTAAIDRELRAPTQGRPPTKPTFSEFASRYVEVVARALR